MHRGGEPAARRADRGRVLRGAAGALRCAAAGVWSVADRVRGPRGGDAGRRRLRGPVAEPGNADRDSRRSDGDEAVIDEASVVTDAERAAAGRWLVTHGVEVPTLTDLLALRLGIRGGARPRGSWRWIVAGVLVAMAANVGFRCLQYLPGVRGVELTDGAFMVFFAIAVQLFVRAPVRVC